MNFEQNIPKISKIDWVAISFSISEFRNYQDLIEEFLVAEKERMDKKSEEAEKNYPNEDEYADWVERNIDRYGEISKIFPNNFRVAFLIQIISFVEFHLKNICDRFYRSENQIFALDDLKGSSDFDKAKLYLKKVAKIDVLSFGEDWKFIDDCRIIRNKLAHQQGLMKKEDSNKTLIEQFAKKHGLIKVVEQTRDFEWRIEINGKELNDKLISSVSSFFKQLLNN